VIFFIKIFLTLCIYVFRVHKHNHNAVNKLLKEKKKNKEINEKISFLFCCCCYIKSTTKHLMEYVKNVILKDMKDTAKLHLYSWHKINKTRTTTKKVIQTFSLFLFKLVSISVRLYFFPFLNGKSVFEGSIEMKNTLYNFRLKSMKISKVLHIFFFTQIYIKKKLFSHTIRT
jgi:hypothetical protein